MNPWRFFEYVTEERTCAFADWYRSMDEAARATFDDVKARLSRAEDWTDGRKEFKHLTERHRPLSEIRFRADLVDDRGRVTKKRKYRPIGLFRPDDHHRDFILFGGASKDLGGLIYEPSTAFDDALTDYRRFMENKGVLRELL